MRKKWELYEANETEIQRLQNENNINLLLAKILVNKGITESEQIRKFLDPTRNDFYDPFLMPDMDKAVDRIITAIDKKEKNDQEKTKLKKIFISDECSNDVMQKIMFVLNSIQKEK